MKTERQSFTMIELLTVVAIIAVLAGIAVGVANLIADKSASAKTEGTIKALELALNMYNDKCGHYYGILSSPIPQRLSITKDIPSNLEGTLWKYLDQKLINSSTVIDGGTRFFKDGWGRPLIYRCPGRFNKTTFDLSSAGPDGKLGSDGTAIDKDTDNSTLGAISNTEYDKLGKDDDVVNFIHNSN